VAGPLIAVWSPKGGTGRTLLAAGLAMHLARRLDQPAALVDLDPGPAGLAALLQTPLRPSLLDYLGQGARPQPHPSGVTVLPGPPRLVDESQVTAEVAASALRQVRQEFPLVVADLSAALRDSTVVALEQADAVLLVTTPDLLAIYACRRFVQEAPLAGIDLSRFRLVINRAAARQEIPDREILELIDLPLAGKVPSLPGLAAAVNRGLLTPTFRSNTDFAGALGQVVANLNFLDLPLRGPSATDSTGAAPMERPTGLIPALRRWWRSR
jgi:pilus assembly protein CpaE